MDKHLLLIICLIILAGCIAPTEQKVISKGPEMKLEVFPSTVFVNDKTNVYVDVLNNDEDFAYDYVYVDIYDTGVMELAEAKEPAIHSNDLWMDPSDTTRLDYPRIVNVLECHKACKEKFKNAYKWKASELWTKYHACKPSLEKGGGICYIAESANDDCTRVAENIFSQHGWDKNIVTTERNLEIGNKKNYKGMYLCCCDVSRDMFTGKIVSGCMTIDKCVICGYYQSGDNYGFEGTCNFMIKSNGNNIPIIVSYKKEKRNGYKAEEFDVILDISFDKFSSLTQVSYINNKLYFHGINAYLGDNEKVLVRFTDKSIVMYATIEKKNNIPTGKIILSNGKGKFSFIPTQDKINNKIIVYAFFGKLATYTGFQPITGRLYAREPITGHIIGSTIDADIILDLDITSDDYGIEENEIRETSQDTIPQTCSSSNDCPDTEEFGYCGVCQHGRCVASHRQQDENDGCDKDCQCKEGLYCDAVTRTCKKISEYKLCEHIKIAQTNKMTKVTTYYYCSRVCVNNDKELGTYTNHAICITDAKSMVNNKREEGVPAFATKSCTKTSECLPLETSAYPYAFDCVVCYQNVCVNSDKLQREGDMCEKDCQCKEGRCIDKKCTIFKPLKTVCDDGTPLDTCSIKKPKYCDKWGYLWDDCKRCGCPNGLKCSGYGTCIPKMPTCSMEIERLLPNDKKTLTCMLIAPSNIPRERVTTLVKARMRYRTKFNITQTISFISKEEYLRKYVQKPQTYVYKNRDIEVTVEFSEPLPIVVTGKDVYISFQIRNIGNGMVYPLRPDDIEIDQWPQIIDVSSCNLHQVLVPEHGIFPKISCKLMTPKLRYLNVYLVNINIRYAYELRKEIEIVIRK